MLVKQIKMVGTRDCSRKNGEDNLIEQIHGTSFEMVIHLASAAQYEGLVTYYQNCRRQMENFFGEGECVRLFNLAARTR